MSNLRRRSLAWMVAVCITALAFPAPVRADAVPEGFTLTQEAEGLQVELVFPQEKVVPGKTTFFVRITDENGLPVEGLRVSLTLTPPGSDDHSKPGKDSHDAQEASHQSDAGHSAENEHDGGEDLHAEEENHGHEPDDDHLAEEDEHGHPEEDDHASEGSATRIRLIRGHDQGEYEGVLEFTQGGRWSVVVHMETESGVKEAAFVVEVDGNPAKPYILGGFLAFNLAVIAAAFYFKHFPAVQKKGQG
jgi:hypothetical protein